MFLIDKTVKIGLWLFDGCLTYTSAPLRGAVKHPPNKLTKLG